MSPKVIRMVKLVNPDKNLLSKSAVKQLEIVEYLEKTKRKTIIQKDLLKETNSSLSSLKSLEKKDIVEIYDEKVYREVLPKYIEYYEKNQLKQEQKKIYKEITHGPDNAYALKGSTGRGKTEV